MVKKNNTIKQDEIIAKGDANAIQLDTSNKAPSFRSAKIEGSIVRIIDSTTPRTGSFSIAQPVIFSNEKTLSPVQKATPQMKTKEELKNYYEVNGKTYKMVSNMFAQTPCFTNVRDFNYQIVKSDIVEATPSTYSSVACSVSTFQPISNGSLRLKWTGSTSKNIELKAKNLNDAVREAFVDNENLKIGMLYIDQPIMRKGASVSLPESNIQRFAPVYNEEGKLVEIKTSNSKKDTINKYVLVQEPMRGGTSYKLLADNTHYAEVNELDFSACKSMDDVLEILNSLGLNCYFLYENGKLVIRTKAVGSLITLEVVDAISPDVDVDLKEVLFSDATPATITTSTVPDVSSFSSVTDGVLNLEINGVSVETTAIDFQTAGVTTVEDIKNVLAGKHIAGVVFDVVSVNQIKISTTETGSTASIAVIPAVSTGTDLSTLFVFGNPVPGSDGAVLTQGTNASGSNMLETYNELRKKQQMGCVLSSTMALDIDFLFQLNTDLVANINLGNRVIFLTTIEDPYMTEATSHGALKEWLRSDLLGIYCGAMIEQTNLDARGAILSMSLGQDVFNTNVALGSKNSLHMKDITIPTANVSQSIDNELLSLINENGSGAIAYFQEGFGWKITIPSATGVWSWADAVNMQNIYKTFSMTLANFISKRKSANKTNDIVTLIHDELYKLCSILTTNGVLTGDVSDFSSIPVDVEIAKNFIQNTDYHTYLYTPDVRDISGKIIPITPYMGFADSIYGFELQAQFLS